MRSRPASARGVEAEDVGEPLQDAALDELIDQLLAEAFDVERAAAREVAQVVLELCGAIEIRAARHGLAFETHARRRADGAARGEAEALRPAPTPRGDHRDDLRNHVAGALHEHAVADAHVLALDLVLVVQRRARNADAADAHRPQPRYGRERSGAPDLHLDGFDDRHLLLGWELHGDRPARGARQVADLLLELEPVHLRHRAVDLDG